MANLINIEQLTKSFDNFKALDGLNLSMEKGQIFGLLGLNGAGKSTTMRCLLTLIQPTSGKIYFEGKDLQTNRNLILRKIGAMVERADHYLFLTAFENVSLQAKLYDIIPSKPEVSKILDTVGLNGHHHQKVKTFSQGMKQRLGIACSLIHNPDLIILDEPANGLDPQGILDLRNLILQLKNEMNKSVLISSHLLNEIEQVADNLAIIHKGKNMIQGSVNELLSDKELIVEIETENGNALASAFHNTQFENEIITIAPKKIFLKTAKENIPILHRIAANTGIAIFSIQNKRKLEDYFFKLTQHD